MFGGGRHTRAMGFIADCEKYNAAGAAGWIVLRFVPRKDWLALALPLITETVNARRQP